MKINNITLEVLASNRPVKQFHKNNRFFIEARENSEFVLKIKNENNRRALIVPSLDNINIIDGKVAGESNQGYIVDANSELVIHGYRIDENTVAKFKFTIKNNAYSAKVGGKTLDNNGKEINLPDIDNIGCIGIKVIFEKIQDIDYLKRFKDLQDEIDKKQDKDNAPYNPWPFYPYIPYIPYIPYRPYRPWWDDNYHPYWDRPYYWRDNTFYCKSTDASNNIPLGNTISNSFTDLNGVKCCINSVSFNSESIQEDTPDFTIGTTWGEKIKDSIIEVKFECSDLSQDTFIMEIFYSDKKSLERFGICFENIKQVSSFPKSFDKLNKSKYCSIPSDYKE